MKSLVNLGVRVAPQATGARNDSAARAGRVREALTGQQTGSIDAQGLAGTLISRTGTPISGYIRLINSNHSDRNLELKRESGWAFWRPNRNRETAQALISLLEREGIADKQLLDLLDSAKRNGSRIRIDRLQPLLNAAIQARPSPQQVASVYVPRQQQQSAMPPPGEGFAQRSGDGSVQPSGEHSAQVSGQQNSGPNAFDPAEQRVSQELIQGNPENPQQEQPVIDAGPIEKGVSQKRPYSLNLPLSKRLSQGEALRQSVDNENASSQQDMDKQSSLSRYAGEEGQARSSERGESDDQRSVSNKNKSDSSSHNGDELEAKDQENSALLDQISQAEIEFDNRFQHPSSRHQSNASSQRGFGQSDSHPLSGEYAGFRESGELANNPDRYQDNQEFGKRERSSTYSWHSGAGSGQFERDDEVLEHRIGSDIDLRVRMNEIQAAEARENLLSDITDLDGEIEKFDNVFTHEQSRFLEIQNSLTEDAKKNLDEVRDAIDDSLDGAQDFESTEVRLTAAVDSHKELTEFVEQNKIAFTANTVGSEVFNDLQARIREYQNKADASGFADEIYGYRDTEDGRETVTTRAMLEYLQDRLEEIKSKHDEILQNASLMELDLPVVLEEHRKTHQELLSGYESRGFAPDKVSEGITLDDCQRVLQDQIAAIGKKDSTLLDKAHKDLKRVQQQLSNKLDELEENLEEFQRYQSNAEHFFGTDDLLVGRWEKVLTSADLERRIGKLKEMQKSLVLKQMPAEVESPVANEEKLSKDQIAKRAELQSLLEKSYKARSGAPVSLDDAESRLKRRFDMFNTVFELLGEVKDPTMFSTAAVRFAPDGNWMAQGLGNALNDLESAYKTKLSELQADQEQLRNELSRQKRFLETEISAIRYRLDDHRNELEVLKKRPENDPQQTIEEAIQTEENIVVLEASIRQDEERLTLLEEDGSNPRSDNRAGGANNRIKLDSRVGSYISRIQERLKASRASQSSGGQGNDLIDESIVKDEERLATLRAEREGLTQITQDQQTIKDNISGLTEKLKKFQGQQQDLVKTYRQLEAETEEMRRRTEQLRNGR